MIKVGFLVSYDYKFLFTSLKQVYEHADKIYLAIDKNRKTWSGNSFDIPESFFQKVKDFDNRKIIDFYFDDFYRPELKPIECDTRERNMLLKRMGRGWLIQLDVDEYIYDFEKIVKYLRKYWYLTLFPQITPISFGGKLVTLFKKISDGYLIINNNERFHFITNQRTYTYIRNNDRIKSHFSNVTVIHQSWARNDDEIRTKITNWGHRNDFDVSEYFQIWQKLSSKNYGLYKNFHPISPKVWDELIFFPAESIDDLLCKYSSSYPQELIELDWKKMLGALYRRVLRNFL